MKVLVSSIVVMSILQGWASLEEGSDLRDGVSPLVQPPVVGVQRSVESSTSAAALFRVATKMLRLEEESATEADTEFLHQHGYVPMGMGSGLIGEEGTPSRPKTATKRKASDGLQKTKKSQPKRKPAAAAEAEEGEPHQRQKLLTPPMKEALRAMAAEAGGKLTREAARADLVVRGLVTKEQAEDRNFFQAIYYFLASNGLLEKTRDPQERLTDEMRDVLRAMAEAQEGGKLSRQAARSGLVAKGLVAKEQAEERHFYQAMHQFLASNGLLEKTQDQQERLAGPMKEALRAMAAEGGGKLIAKEARDGLVNQGLLTEEDLKDSKFSKTIHTFLSRNDLLEKTRDHQERLTGQMKDALRAMAEAQEGGNLTRQAARSGLVAKGLVTKEQTQDVKTYDAIYYFLASNGLLEKTRDPQERLTDEMRGALRAMAEAQEGGKLSRQAARSGLVAKGLVTKEQAQDAYFYQAMHQFLASNGLLEKTRDQKKRLTDEMKEALRAMAAEAQGKISSKDVISGLVAKGLLTVEQAKDLRFSKAIYGFLVSNRLFEATRDPQERLTDEMRGALRAMAAEAGGKLTRQDARDGLVAKGLLTKEQAEDPNFSQAIYYFLRRSTLLKKKADQAGEGAGIDIQKEEGEEDRRNGPEEQYLSEGAQKE